MGRVPRHGAPSSSPCGRRSGCGTPREWRPPWCSAAVALWSEVTRNGELPRVRPLIVVLVRWCWHGRRLRVRGLRRPLPGTPGRRMRHGRAASRGGIHTGARGLPPRVYGYPLPNTYYAKVSGPLTSRIAAAARQLGDLAATRGCCPISSCWRRRGDRGARPSVGILRAAVRGGLARVGLRRRDVFGERSCSCSSPGAPSRAMGRGGHRPLHGRIVAALAFQLAPSPATAVPYAEESTPLVELGRSSASPSIAGRPWPSTPRQGALYSVSRRSTARLTDAHIGHRPATRFSVGHNSTTPTTSSPAAPT